MQSAAQELPLPVFGEQDYPEDIRLRYRYLDLRRERLHANIVLRSQVIASIRRRMIEAGFTEFQTPILTASSPEGARDYLVPSRVHPGKFYALPQAPQMFKQLIMVAGFDRYFQIAPCFRDEDARADRSPGEFYQLDFEMSFVTQDDVFEAIEPVLAGVFEEFADGKKVTPAGEFPRIPYREAMLKYGSDKPDLRNPILISDVSDHFRGSGFGLFARIVEGGGARPRDSGARHRREEPQILRRHERMGAGRRPCRARLHHPEGAASWAARSPRITARRRRGQLIEALGPRPRRRPLLRRRQGGGQAAKLAGAARTRIAEELGLIDDDAFQFCWIVDFPMYEYDEEAKKVDFSHNPFSMPQGGLEALEEQGPARDPRLPVRHRLQRRGAVLGRDPQPPPGDHVQGVRDRRLYRRPTSTPISRA